MTDKEKLEKIVEVMECWMQDKLLTSLIREWVLHNYDRLDFPHVAEQILEALNKN